MWKHKAYLWTDGSGDELIHLLKFRASFHLGSRLTHYLFTLTLNKIILLLL
jgi:hypothetical protein